MFSNISWVDRRFGVDLSPGVTSFDKRTAAGIRKLFLQNYVNRTLMRIRMRKQILLVAMLCTLSHGAFATMPTLTPKPKPMTPAACEKWAASQDDDAIGMWGIQETGVSSRDLALRRLALSCLGDPPPEIVGFGSSAGFDEGYCRKHSAARNAQELKRL